jgi:hypothetical protein
MLMHRRRRRGGRLGNLPAWLANTIPGMPKVGSPATVTAAASTKKALKGKADPKAKLERELARGSECCPVIRVKCERREVTVMVKKTGFEQYVANPYASEKTYKKKKVTREVPVKQKVKLCAVSAGKHQGDLLPPKEAKQELQMLRSLLKAENCSVRTAGDKLGSK